MQEKYQFPGPRLAKPWCSWIFPSSTSALLKYSRNFWTTHDAETRDRMKRVMTTHNGILRSLIIKPHSKDYVPLHTMEFIHRWLLDHEWDRIIRSFSWSHSLLDNAWNGNVWSHGTRTDPWDINYRYWTIREIETHDHMNHVRLHTPGSLGHRSADHT